MLAPILLTGGSGRLGTELSQLLSLEAPPSSELDITDASSIDKAIDSYKPSLVVHSAAYTDVAGAESDMSTCWRVNVDGTRNLVRVLDEQKLPLIHISTDYVFYGDRGDYKEDDPLGPVRNYYALSKLVAEELTRYLSSHLVIRTSFRPRAWPYEAAFDDVYTSQDYVDVIAPEIALAIRHFEAIPYHTLHIATERKSVYDLAKQRKPDVKRGSRADIAVDLPTDISLSIERWEALKASFSEDEHRF